MDHNYTQWNNHICSSTMVCSEGEVYFVGGRNQECWEWAPLSASIWRECLIKGWQQWGVSFANKHTDLTGQGSWCFVAWESLAKHLCPPPRNSPRKPLYWEVHLIFGMRHLLYVLRYSLGASNFCHPPSIPQKVISLFSLMLLWLWSSMQHQVCLIL